MKKDCLAKLTLTQKLTHEKDFYEALKVQAVGKIENLESVIRVTYKNYEENGNKTDCSIKIEKNSVTVERINYFSSFMVFEENKRHIFKHKIAEGYVIMGIFTEKIENTFKKDGKIILHYTISANSQLLGENKMEIEIKEV